MNNSPVQIPVSFESVAQITETVSRIVEYLEIRDRLAARAYEIERDFRELRGSRDDQINERSVQRAYTEVIVQALIDRGQHELAVRAFEAFMNAAPNFSAAAIAVINKRIEFNPINTVTKS